jgi:hypothetical protein
MSENPIQPISRISGRGVEQDDHFTWDPAVGIAAKPTGQATGDATQLSPLAQFVATLEALRSSDPAKYAEVTQKVAAILDSNAQMARSQGNASAAGQLDQLSVDFSAASLSGHLGGLLQDLSAAVSHPAPAGSSVLAVLETGENHNAQITALDSVAILIETEPISEEP